MIDEGYIKFGIDWTKTEPLANPLIDELAHWRRPLYDAGLIGQYEDIGVGFGNLSMRGESSDAFIISGTQTGHLAELDQRHFALVTAADPDANRVACRGPLQASSESMTHAAIYAVDSSINAVVHVHSRELWARLQGEIATTAEDVAYGTPAMAAEFARLYRDTGFAVDGVAVMAGHEEGLISIGTTIEEAASRILALNSGSS